MEHGIYYSTSFILNSVNFYHGMIEVKSNPKQPSCKKSMQPQEAHCVKDVKSKVAVKMVKLLITTIQVNLVPNPSETWRRQHKFT